MIQICRYKLSIQNINTNSFEIGNMKYSFSNYFSSATLIFIIITTPRNSLIINLFSFVKHSLLLFS